MKIPSEWPKHTAPGSRGRVSAITANIHTGYRRHSYLPYVDAEILRLSAFEWPRCTETCERPTHSQKLVILGGDIALLDEAVGPPLGEWLIERAYPGGIVRHILRATQSHFESNLPSRKRLSIGPPPIQ